LERSNSELTYTAFLLGLKLFGLIFIVTAIVYEVEDYTKDAFTVKLQWHSALYFTVVALTTVVSSTYLLRTLYLLLRGTALDYL
jgi:glucan phosphoethanolaminetransferase (alkaline phosphatase superfamily)